MTQQLVLAITILAVTLSQAAEPSTFSAALAAANRLSSSPTYQQYEQFKFCPAIGTPFANAMVACTKDTKADVTFDCVFVISADGHIERVLHAPQQRVAACVAAQLRTHSLPPPPRDSWLVSLHEYAPMKSSNHNPSRRKCDIVLDDEGWRIEYTQQGVRVRHRLSAKDKNAAVKEAAAQGFTLIRIYRESTPGHLFSEGKVVARQAEEEDEEE